MTPPEFSQSTDVSFPTLQAHHIDYFLGCKHFPKLEFVQIEKPKIAEVEEKALSSINSEEMTERKTPSW